MTVFASSRQTILDRIRNATRDISTGNHLGEEQTAAGPLYIRRGALQRDACLRLMIERLREYDAEVVESTPGQLPAAIAAQLASSGRRSLVAPAGLPAKWLVSGFEWKIDGNLTDRRD